MRTRGSRSNSKRADNNIGIDMQKNDGVFSTYENQNIDLKN